MIYFVQPRKGGPVKIGYSANVPSRLKSLESHYKEELVLLKTLPGGQKEERALHERFAHLRYGDLEQFRPEADLMEFIGRPLLVSANPDQVEAMPAPVVSFGMRCTVAYKAWLQALANLRRKEMADVIDEALEDYSAKWKFDRPPKR